MNKNTLFPAIAALASISTASFAGPGLQITFEEFAPANDNSGYLTNEYTGIGVTWNTTDDGSIWGGNSNGDPGGWDLEGTNGPQFLGFNGGSYSATMLFDSTINSFQFDASRSGGSDAGNTITVQGYNDGILTNFKTVTFGDINVWSNITLGGSFDEIAIFGSGASFHPFGVDNIQWNAVPTPSSLALLGMGGFLAGRRRR